MSYLQLIRREMHSSLPKLLLMSGLGGISNALLLAVINAAVQGTSDGHPPGFAAATLFLAALFMFMRAQLYVTVTSASEIEGIIHKLRLRVTDYVRNSELLEVENITGARIISGLTSDTAVLSQASNILCFTVQGAILIFFVGFYVAHLSPTAFSLAAAIVIGAGTTFYLKNKRIIRQKNEAIAKERQIFDRLADFLDGFKEVRLNSGRSADLFADAVEVSTAAANTKIGAQAETFKMIVGYQISMYILLGAVVFVTPTVSQTVTSISDITTALLFVVGACFGLLQSIPLLTNANAAADRLNQLEKILKTKSAVGEPIAAVRPGHFSRIEMRRIVFRYVDRFSDTAFQIGPIDFSLEAGELVFITGGNGSGKSTFLRVVAGLYPPHSGEIFLDGVRLDDNSTENYRALMSAIFFDYHLFHRLYGISEPDAPKIQQLLNQSRLAEVTGYSHGAFRTLNLSSGQSHRLALVVGLLEKRPILLLDEWTADQDPEFRHKFYEEFLPEVVRAGTATIVITHDERYLDELTLPGRKILMDQGRFVDEQLIGRR